MQEACGNWNPWPVAIVVIIIELLCTVLSQLIYFGSLAEQDNALVMNKLKSCG